MCIYGRDEQLTYKYIHMWENDLGCNEFELLSRGYGTKMNMCELHEGWKGKIMMLLCYVRNPKPCTVVLEDLHDLMNHLPHRQAIRLYHIRRAPYFQQSILREVDQSICGLWSSWEWLMHLIVVLRPAEEEYVWFLGSNQLEIPQLSKGYRMTHRIMSHIHLPSIKISPALKCERYITHPGDCRIPNARQVSSVHTPGGQNRRSCLGRITCLKQFSRYYRLRVAPIARFLDIEESEVKLTCTHNPHLIYQHWILSRGNWFAARDSVWWPESQKPVRPMLSKEERDAQTHWHI